MKLIIQSILSRNSNICEVLIFLGVYFFYWSNWAGKDACDKMAALEEHANGVGSQKDHPTHQLATQLFSRGVEDTIMFNISLQK